MPEKKITQYKYSPKMLELIRGYVKDNYTVTAIAEALGVVNTTLYTWKRTIPAVKEAFEQGRLREIEEVKSALYKRATGYDYQEETIETGKGIKTVTKHLPGDTTAQQVYLYNKDPENWRARNHSENIRLTQNNISVGKMEIQLEDLQSNWKKLTGNKDIVDVTPTTQKPGNP